MSDSSEDEASISSGSKWIPYRERPEWADVKPIPQDEGPVPVVRIAYSPKFTEIYDYYRAIVCSGEVSQRALDLTKDALEMNPANYTVWHHRRTLLKALNSDLYEELAYCRAVLEENSKNYQIWQHRRLLVEWLNDPSHELRLTEIVLSQDAKNYHAWQHRQWVVKTFNLFDDELKFVNRLLEDDVRNNSAWNHRFFIVCHEISPGEEILDVKIRGLILEREVHFTLKAIDLVKENESSWNYLNGLLSHCDESEKSVLEEKIFDFCRKLFEIENVRSTFLLATLVDLEYGRAVASDNAGVKKEHLDNALKLCHSLADEHDTVRKEYWNYYSQSLQLKVKE